MHVKENMNVILVEAIFFHSVRDICCGLGFCARRVKGTKIGHIKRTKDRKIIRPHGKFSRKKSVREEE